MLLAAPLSAFFVLNARPDLNGMYDDGPAHFWVVAIICGIALAIGAAVLPVALRLRNPAIAYLALGLMSIAGIFGVHGITTPGVLYEFTPAVVINAHASLVVGAVFFGLSALPTDSWLNRLARRRLPLIVVAGTAALAGYMALNLVHPHWAGNIAMSEPPVVYATLGLAIALFVTAALRFLGSYRLAPIGFTAALAVSAIVLAEADVMLVFSDVWTGTWWGYHVAMLAGFGVAAFATVAQYRSRGSLSWAVQGMYRLRSLVENELDATDAVARLSVAIERKDGYTAGHTMRVAEISVRIAQALGLPPERRRLLARAGVLHDVGKIWVPDEILNKPGRLTPEEFEVIKQHPILGHDALRRVGSLDEEVAVVAAHHEWMDGSGYPYGLTGEQIPLESRIIAVADVYDSLATDRPQRPAFDREKVHTIMREDAGLHLDPGIVEVWLEMVDDYDDLVASVEARRAIHA